MLFRILDPFYAGFLDQLITIRVIQTPCELLCSLVRIEQKNRLISFPYINLICNLHILLILVVLVALVAFLFQ